MSWIDKIVPGRKRAEVSPSASVREEEFVWRPAVTPTATSRQDDTTAFPRFNSTAGDQLDTKSADPFAVVRSKLRNAYTPSQPITNQKMFAGRREILNTLIRCIEDQRLHTVIYGERGIGKTSLLQVLAAAAREARYLVVYVTCGASSEFDETFRGIASKIPLTYHSAYGPTTPEGERGDSLASILSSEPMTVSSASEALAYIEGTRVLVILDEYDRTVSEDFRRSIAELLKSLSDQAVRVQILVAGVAANLTELVANVPSVQRNVFAMRIPKMSAEEVRSVVKNGETLCDLQFEETAVHAIISRSMGFPYLASLISHRAALVALDHGRLDVQAGDIATATEEAVSEFRGRISRRSQLQISELVAAGHLAVLGALAGAAQSTGGWFTVEDISALYADTGAIAAAKSTAEWLGEQHLLIEMGDDGFGKAFRFIEATVPVYLWLLAAKGEFFSREQPVTEHAAE
jgi:Cdc6-like AAA superfamily ATPase